MPSAPPRPRLRRPSPKRHNESSHPSGAPAVADRANLMARRAICWQGKCGSEDQVNGERVLGWACSSVGRSNKWVERPRDRRRRLRDDRQLVDSAPKAQSTGPQAFGELLSIISFVPLGHPVQDATGSRSGWSLRQSGWIQSPAANDQGDSAGLSRSPEVEALSSPAIGSEIPGTAARSHPPAVRMRGLVAVSEPKPLSEPSL